jgi:2,5-diketo-D-gluconate reductase A
VPAVNQIELHPYFQNREVAAFCNESGIVIEAWSPIAQGDVLDDEVVGEIAQSLGRSVAQVVLRWHIQHGYVVFPKSTTPERIEENFRIFDFELDDDQMARIDDLDRGQDGRRGPHPARFAYLPS